MKLPEAQSVYVPPGPQAQSTERSLLAPQGCSCWRYSAHHSCLSSFCLTCHAPFSAAGRLYSWWAPRRIRCRAQPQPRWKTKGEETTPASPRTGGCWPLNMAPEYARPPVRPSCRLLQGEGPLVHSGSCLAPDFPVKMSAHQYSSPGNHSSQPLISKWCVSVPWASSPGSVAAALSL